VQYLVEDTHTLTGMGFGDTTYHMLSSLSSSPLRFNTCIHLNTLNHTPCFATHAAKAGCDSSPIAGHDARPRPKPECRSGTTRNQPRPLANNLRNPADNLHLDPFVPCVPADVSKRPDEVVVECEKVKVVRVCADAEDSAVGFPGFFLRAAWIIAGIARIRVVR
jgi:hypothetical protein